MADNNEEIVKLTIEAEHLSSDEINKAVKDINGLGSAAKKTEKELDKLKIEQNTIDSYEQLKKETATLRTELSKSQVEYDKANSALKKNKKATDEQKESVARLKIALSDQKKAYNSVYAEQQRVLKQIKKYRQENEDAAKQQERLNKEYAETDEKLKGQQQRLEKLTSALKANVAERKKELGLTGKESAETDKLTVKLKQYEKELNDLNKAKREGTLTTGDYIRKEEKLRKQLSLTASQAKATRQAVEADHAAMGKRAKSTDLLTTATRRLAQAYTVLLAAQKATEAIGAGVREYGALEAAITKVEKTTGAAREQVVAMTDEIQKMASETTPTATNELLRFAEVAGQLGVKSTEDILSIVAAADALEVSTNLAGDEAATLLTRILTLTGEGVPNIQNLASSVVELGNNFAATEDEIVHMTKEIATAGSSLNLGSAAAAAFGTTLKSIGLPAERSRTAMQRLAQAIKTASAEGGDELKTLLNITNLTGEEFEKSLGEKPEAVITSFLKGLNRLEEGGQTVSRTLRSVGIDGQDALSVFEGLSSATIQLEYAMNLSNKAYEEGNKHFAEAAKAYADQESAIGRLINTFTELKTKIGETYTDEVDVAIRGATELINDQSGAVVNMMENLSSLGEGLFELGTAITDLLSPLDSLGANFEQIFTPMRVMLNSITIGFRSLGLAINEAILFITEGLALVGAASDDSVTKLEENSKRIKEAMEGDFEDIGRAIDRHTGDSSAAYEDLIDVTKRYTDATSDLSSEQLNQLDTILQSGEYNKDLEKVYIELTASIVRLNREREIKEQLEKQEEERAARRIKAEEERAAKRIKLETDVKNILDEVGFSSENLNKANDDLRESYESGSISATEYGARQLILAEAEKQLISTKSTLTNAQASFNQEISSSIPEISRLNAVVEDQKLKMQELNKEISRTTQGTALYNQLIAKRAELERTLEENQARLAQMQEYENQTIFQLIETKRQHLFTMELLELQYRSGSLTAGEYRIAVDKLKQTLSVLNELIGDNSEVQELNTVKIQERNSALNEQVVITRQLTEEIDRNTESLVRNRGEMVAMTSTTSGANEKAAALIKEIGLDAYNKLLRGTIKYTGTGFRMNRLAQQRLRQMEEEAWLRSREGNGGVSVDNYGAGLPFGTGSNSGGGTYTVEIKLPNGSSSTVEVANEGEASSLVDILTQLGDINIQGVQ